MLVISVLRRARRSHARAISRTIGQGGDVGGRFRGTGRRLALVVVLALVGAGIAYAAIPDSSGVIHGCYSTKNGALRVIDSSAKCANGEVALNWNQQGPKGDTGATGPQGAVGPQGPAGPKGDTGAAGPQGAPGPAGAQGPKGDTGATGPQGAVGPQGPAGPNGDTGPAGAQGVPGPAGAQGPKGDTGPAGPQGPSGVVATNGSYAGHIPSPLPTTAFNSIAQAGDLVRVTLNQGDRVLVNVSGVFGTTNPLGATGLYVGICYRNLAAFPDGGLRWGQQELLDTYTGLGNGFAADSQKPLLINLSMIQDGLTGPTDVGLCYWTTNDKWDHNGGLWTTAVVVHS